MKEDIIGTLIFSVIGFCIDSLKGKIVRNFLLNSSKSLPVPFNWVLVICLFILISGVLYKSLYYIIMKLL